MKSGYFKTKKRLEVAIDNADKIEGMQDYLDNTFFYLTFDTDNQEEIEAIQNGELVDCPYWALEGSIDYGINGKVDYDPEKLKCEYVAGYYWNHEQGEVVEGKGKFLTTISLPAEQEHQADDGDLVYEYRGESFMAIWETN